MIRILIFLVFAASCSSIKVLNREAAETKSEPSSRANIVQISKPFLVTIKTGKVQYVKFKTELSNNMYSLSCGGVQIPVMIKSNVGHLYLTESYFSKRKGYDCSLEGKKIFTVEVREFPYKREQLNVDKKRVFLSKKDLARVIKEREIKKKIYLDSSKFYLFDSEFKRPLDSFITSYYGNKRVFNNKKTSQHLGNDFRAKVGTPIPASNRGRVVYAGDLFYSGNVVILDHGLGIFTAYGHLSKILVEKGSIVNRGDQLGLSGMTGRVSGPHLHWGVKINGNWVDGFELVSESEKHYTKNE